MFKFLRASALTCASFTAAPLFHSDTVSAEKEEKISRSAICIMIPCNNSGVKGLVSFHQKKFTDPIQIVANISGLNPNSSHGIHIHQYGDLTQGCATSGPRFEPLNQNEEEKHIGDLGRVKTNERGNGYLATEDYFYSLYGDNSILGRSVVVHGTEDDLGQAQSEENQKSLNLKGQLACGVIGWAEKFKNLPPN